jgi:hypothetical protein
MIKEVPVSALLLQAGHVPRPTLEDAAGEQLQRSVQELGLLQPLLVSEEGSGRFLIIDGAPLPMRQGSADGEGLVYTSLEEACPGDHELIRTQLHANYVPIAKKAFAARAKKKKMATGD